MSEHHSVNRSAVDGAEEADEPFMSRWSRRKLERSEEPPPEAVAETSLEAKPEQPPVVTDRDLAPPETLSDDADFSGFLSPGVSEELRQKALQRLFSAARFNVVDGLDDYAEDFTQFAPLGEVITHEMRRLLEDHLEDSTDEKSLAKQKDEEGDSVQNPDLDQEKRDNGDLES